MEKGWEIKQATVSYTLLNHLIYYGTISSTCHIRPTGPLPPQGRRGIPVIHAPRSSSLPQGCTGPKARHTRASEPPSDHGLFGPCT